MTKRIKWRSVRTKIFIVFFCFILFAGILIGINNYFHHAKSKLDKKLSRLTEFESTVSKAVYFQNRVFLQDFSTMGFYLRANTFNQVSYHNHLQHAYKLLKKIKNKELEKDPVMESAYRDTKDDLAKVDKYYNKIVYLQKQRGFRDAGMEGRMREYAHRMEDELGPEYKTMLLQLRRHEKDFFLRGDTLYAEQLRLQSSLLASRLPQKDSSLRYCLTMYATTFDSIRKIEMLTGIHNRGGYTNMLSIYTSQLHTSVTDLYAAFKRYHQDMISRIDKLSIFATVVLFIVATIMSLLISSSITNRVRKLSVFMNRYVESKFRLRSRFEPDYNKDEITELVKNFEILEHEITVQFEKYKNKVETRTEEILKQKTEIEKQKVIIEEKNVELTKQRNVLDFQNQHILESLKAAHGLQKHFFPSEEKMRHILGKYHFRFEPLDIVSGDFYWVETNEHGIYIALADCTGHGAHGALMSINGINMLNHALKEKQLVQPYDILNYMSEKVYQQFGSKDDFPRNTLDIALIRIHKGKLYFAGAQQDILIIKSKEVIKLMGDRRPLGWTTGDELYRFAGQFISVEAGDRIVLFTDGITDQFGGLSNKKFKKSHFFGLIEQSVAFKTNDLFEVVNDSFDNWCNGYAQTDDVSLLMLELDEERAEGSNLWNIRAGLLSSALD